jgi:hypothetical protein
MALRLEEVCAAARRTATGRAVKESVACILISVLKMIELQIVTL